MDAKNYPVYLCRDASGKGSRLWLKGEDDSAWVLELHPMLYTDREASTIADHPGRHNPTAKHCSHFPFAGSFHASHRPAKAPVSGREQLSPEQEGLVVPVIGLYCIWEAGEARRWCQVDELFAKVLAQGCADS
jgi:hypothetical protein